MSKKMLPPIHLATSDDELRPVLMHIEIKQGIATATNASLIARMNLAEYSNLTEECIKALNGKMIHRDVWESVLDADMIEVEGDTLHYSKGSVKAQYDITCYLKFPDHKSIIDKIANSRFDQRSFVSFRPDYVLIAKKLFPAENLIMRFYKDNDMMVLFPSGKAKGFVGIMTIKMEDENAVLDFSLS